MFIDAVISALAQKSFNGTWSKARKKIKVRGEIIMGL